MAASSCDAAGVAEQAARASRTAGRPRDAWGSPGVRRNGTCGRRDAGAALTGNDAALGNNSIPMTDSSHNLWQETCGTFGC